MHNDAIRELEKAKDLSGNGTYNLAVLGNAYAASGRESDARRVLGQLLKRSKQGYVPADLIAAVYAGLGQKDRAFE